MIHYTEVSQCLVFEGENRRVLKVGKISHLEIWCLIHKGVLLHFVMYRRRINDTATAGKRKSRCLELECVM